MLGGICYQLKDFDADQAKHILNAAVNTDAAPFEPPLIQAIVKDLEKETFIRPAELQVVSTGLKLKKIYTVVRY